MKVDLVAKDWESCDRIITVNGSRGLKLYQPWIGFGTGSEYDPLKIFYPTSAVWVGLGRLLLKILPGFVVFWRFLNFQKQFHHVEIASNHLRSRHF
jgi:hypothetical protein